MYIKVAYDAFDLSYKNMFKKTHPNQSEIARTLKSSAFIYFILVWTLHYSITLLL